MANDKKTTKARVLMVDDEQSILSACERLLRKEEFDLDSTSSPQEALQWVKEKQYAVIISDQRMPDMEGTQLLEQIKEIAPDTIRILLTGYADMNAALDAINKGGVYRFLTKPWDDEELKLTIRHAVEHAQLEKSFIGSVKLLAQLGEVHSSMIGSHSKRVAGLAKQVAEKMELAPQDVFQVEMAGMLHDIGKIGIPNSLLEKKEDELTDTEQSILKKHVLQGESIVAMIPNLQPAAQFIRHHHESFNGSGYPDKLKGNKIPIGSRILAAVDAFDKALNTKNIFKAATPSQAMQHLIDQAPAQLDPEIVKVVKECIESDQQNRNTETEIEIRASDLSEGMVLSRDLKTTSGVMILSRETTINKKNYAQVKKFLESTPFIEGIFIYRNKPVSA